MRPPLLSPLVRFGLGLVAVSLTGSLAAQSEYSGYRADPSLARLAGVEQDIQLLRRQIGQLTLEIEGLKRENETLRQALAAGGGTDFNRALEGLRAQMQAENQRLRQDLLEEMKKQIERLANQTQQALQALAKSVEAGPSANPATAFSSDYPKEGVAYTVQSGDTLSGIARRFNSTVKDIQNANKIADPRDLKVGQNLFIPQAQPAKNGQP